MSLTLSGPTFRDPAGSLSLEDDRAVRTISPSARRAVLDFLGSALCTRMQRRGDLIAAEIIDPDGDMQLVHPRIPVPTYPWEWTPSQWLAAAELTLALCAEALTDGWILKDATPLNILFLDNRPVLVDILSFERRDRKSSIWLAYGQYMRTFLLPMLMYRMQGWPLALSLFRRDGLEPAEIYQSLNWLQRLSPRAFWPITLPTWLEKNTGGPAKKPTAAVTDPGATLHILRRTVAGLRKRTRAALPASAGSEWSSYKSTLTHYTPEQSAAKKAWIKQTLSELQPAWVLDIGANTGDYSALAASAGAHVVAIERDAATAERLFQMSRARQLSIQTIHADLGRPTPAVGWNNDESSALIPRLEGRFDMVLLLAVIHHLLLLEQIPLSAIAQLCHRLTRSYLVIEWVPVTDPMFQSLMRGRTDLYGHLTELHLRIAIAGLFRVARRHGLENGRVLFLLERLDRMV